MNRGSGTYGTVTNDLTFHDIRVPEGEEKKGRVEKVFKDFSTNVHSQFSGRKITISINDSEAFGKQKLTST